MGQTAGQSGRESEHVEQAAGLPGRADSSGRTSRIGAASALTFAAVAEVIGGFSLLRSGLPVIALLALHALVVAALIGSMRRLIRSGADATDVTVGITATAALGPLGAFAAAISALLPPRGDPPEHLAQWYERIALATPNDPVTRLADRVAVGRTMNLEAPAPQSFLHLMRRGPLSERQAALGLIARKFHPDYLPTLSVALRSPEPVVRVQAAAVAARIQPELKTWLAKLGAAEAGRLTAQTEDLLRDMRAILASGLVDNATASAGRDLVRDVSRNELKPAGVTPGAAGALPVALGRVLAREDLLINSGQLGELRRMRHRYRAIGQRACVIRRRIVHKPGPTATPVSAGPSGMVETQS